MYVPEHFRVSDISAVYDFIEHHAFAALSSIDDESHELIATHLPLVLDRHHGNFGMLLGHIARANPQWQHLERRPSALAIFSGPHAYVSPRWYQDQREVPTWNYVALYVQCHAHVTRDPKKLRDILERLVTIHEAGAPEPWTIDKLPAVKADRALNEIVGIELEIVHIDAKAKLSQNRSERDRSNVAEELVRSPDPLDQMTGQLMRQM